MEISTVQFQENFLKIIDEVRSFRNEVIITKNGRPWVKLVSFRDKERKSFIGSLTGVGKTEADLSNSFEDEWESDGLP